MVSPLFGNVENFGGTSESTKYYSPDSVAKDEYWNYSFRIDKFSFGNEFYCSFVIDPKDEFKLDNDENDYIKLKLFVGKDVVLEKSLNKNLWNFLCDNCSDDFKYFVIGRCYIGGFGVGSWHYLEGDCYSLRLYETALTNEQIQENREKTENYHNLLVSEE